MTSDPSRRVYATLNGIRGVAAIAVATLHGQGFFGAFMARGGYLAVDLFFVLSGFVLAHAYEDRFARGMTTRTFFWIRTLRLYPLYVLGAAIGSISAAIAWSLGSTDLTTGQLVWALAFNAAMLPTPVIEPGMRLYPVNVPGWTLFFEILVNLVYVSIYRVLTLRLLAAICILSATGLVFAGLSAGHLDLGSIWGSFSGGLCRVLFSFFAGVLIYHCQVRFRIGTAAAWLALALVVAVVFIPVAPGLRSAYDIASVLLVFPMIVLFAAATDPGPRLSRIFDGLGTMSFALYAVHVPLFEFARRVVRILGIDPASLAPWAGIGMLAVMLPLALLLERLYDAPIRRRLGHRRRGLRKA